MKNELIRRFVQLGRKGEEMLRDEDIALRPREYYGFNRHIQCEHSLIFDIVAAKSGQIAGEIALRIGDSPEQFYLGHIGYHINPPYRGHAYAAKACRMCGPLFEEFGMRTAVITTDPDNLPSIRTCERLGCELESIVKVPPHFSERLEISHEKCRFIWTPTGEEKP